METFFVDMLQKGGPAAFVSIFGFLWLRSDLKGQIENVTKDIQSLEKVLRERCGIIHKEVDRRLEGFDKKWDGTTDR